MATERKIYMAEGRRLWEVASWSAEISLLLPGLGFFDREMRFTSNVAKMLISSLEVVGSDEPKVSIFSRVDIDCQPKPLVGLRIFIEKNARLRWVDRPDIEIEAGSKFSIDYGDCLVVISILAIPE